MRYACLVWLIAGCGFSSEPFASGDPGSDPGGTDPGGGSGGSGGSGAAPGACDVTNANLRLCLSFGVDPMVRDLINPARMLVAGNHVLPILNAGGRDATFDGVSELLFGDTNNVNDDINKVTELTFEFWMFPAAAPLATTHSGLLDNDKEYFATYEPSGAVRCGIGSTSVVSRATVPIDHRWHHVACSYGADQTLRVYVDGNVSGCTQVEGGIPQTGTAGLAIGSEIGAAALLNKYLGSLGRLHLYASALPPGDLCKRADRTNCNTSCPGSDGSDPRGPR